MENGWKDQYRLTVLKLQEIEATEYQTTIIGSRLTDAKEKAIKFCINKNIADRTVILLFITLFAFEKHT